MKVMVTGGTGFVGAHSVKALVDAGHQVRLLVRSPDRIDQCLKPLGVDANDFVVGDMGDPDSVEEALEGCEAVLHCAAVLALERRRAAEMLEANPRGAETVIGAAVRRGLDPILHVSSTAALFDPEATTLHSDLEPSLSASAYGQSKALAEQVARRYQADGAPVTITYPGSVIGPAAGPLLGELAKAITTQLQMGFMPIRDAQWQVIDVRDLGAVHAAAMRPGRGPRRYMCGGRLLTMTQQADVYRSITGRSFPVVPFPGAAFRVFGSFMDLIGQVAPIDSVITGEGMSILTSWVPTDDHLISEELGIEYRDPTETFTDAIRSILDAGKISARQAGKLADEAATGTWRSD